jgi:hypothetical protein
MISFTPDEVVALARGPRPWPTPGARHCPACGEQRVRSYVQRSARNGRPIIFDYVWCAHCRRYASSTGPMPDDLAFDDPLADAGDPAWGNQGDAFFAALDTAWDQGLLPQTYTKVPQR